MMKSNKSTFGIYLKGIAMGIADLVPGVSGGTIALITNIYEDLISSINHVNAKEILALFGANRKTSWQKINGPFLLPLFLGIATSILFLSSIIGFFLENHALALWSFFFGLIFASSILICKDVKQWSASTIIGLIVGGLISFLISFLSPAQATEALPYLFLCGMLMIMAMILPGISGAFILVLLGAYETALETVELVRSFRTQGFLNLLAFGLGAIIGLKLFAHWVGKLYQNYRDPLLATMSGFMFGSLYKVWPWKQYTNDETRDQIAVLPIFERSNSELWIGLGFILIGSFVIYAFHKMSQSQKR
jgi:putative membrane protein